MAMLPMQDADRALSELECALDALKADGLGLLTRYGSQWPGHASSAPVMNETNRRQAILHTQPTAADCCRKLQPDAPPTVVEFGTDTTRTIVDLVSSGMPWSAAQVEGMRIEQRGMKPVSGPMNSG